MPEIDLVYDVECPNVTLARANLLRALVRSGLRPIWQEYRIGDPNNPFRVQGFGSPTILVDGNDVAHAEPGSESCCRLYIEHGTRAGAPSVDTIAAALTAASASQAVRPHAHDPTPPSR